MNMSDNFFSDNAQKLEQAILKLSVENPELFQPPIPGSVEAEQLEQIAKRMDDLSNLSLADIEAYYKEHGTSLDINKFFL